MKHTRERKYDVSSSRFWTGPSWSVKAKVPYIRMRRADRAVICGCFSAFSSIDHNAVRWEHCRIPLFIISSSSKLFTTRISFLKVASQGPARIVKGTWNKHIIIKNRYMYV